MKIFQHTIRAIVCAMTLCLLAQGSFAYAPATTHAGLTQEIVSYYEELNGEKFSIETAGIVIQGSVDEDNPSLRCLNHFYDPVHDVGLNGARSSPVWATDDLVGNEFTWNKGIEAYAHGDERMAMATLGRILHLIEDASVPDHTRNDPHMGDGAGGLNTGASPFEGWTNEHKDRATLLGSGKKLADEGVQMNDCANLRDCFDFMAGYSNGNFFSKDTIDSRRYLSPTVSGGDEKYGYGLDELTGKFEKLYIYKKINGKIEFSLTSDSDFSVISDNFDRLERQVIPTGARVIELYLAEAESARAKYLAEQKAAQEKAVAEQVALNEKLHDAGIFEQLAFGLKDIFIHTPSSRIASLRDEAFSLGGRAMKGFATVLNIGTNTTVLIAGSNARATEYATNVIGEYEVQKAKEGQVLATAAVSATVGVANQTTDELLRLFQRLTSAKNNLQEIALQKERTAKDVTENGEVLGESTTKENAPRSSMVFTGGAYSPSEEPKKTIVILGVAEGSLPIPPFSDPLPEADAILPDATTTDATSTPPDTLAPEAPAIIVPNASPYLSATTTLSISGTAEASSTVTLSWTEGSTRYILVYVTGENGEWSYGVVIPEGETSFTLTATDEAGNLSPETNLIVTVVLPPPPPTPTIPRAPLAGELLINEIAWGGTFADPSHEWIELYNTTRDPLDLSGVTLRTTDGGLSLALSGILPAREYLVLSGKHDDGARSVSGPSLLLELPWGDGLTDMGEELLLLYATTSDEGITTETALDKLAYCLNWCGRGGAGVSMERWRYDRPTSDYTGNWKTEMAEFETGSDVLGETIAGTPGTRNGANYLLSLGSSIGADLVLSAENGGYFIDGGPVTLMAGKRLTIDAGVVVKYRSSTSALLVIRGVLSAMGTETEPIVFTTTADDRFGGDIFNDGPASGALARTGGIDFFNTSAGSSLEYTQFYNLKLGPYFDRTTATMTGVSIVDSNEGIELYKSTVNASDIVMRNISINDAMQVYGASTLNISSTTIIGVGGRNDAFDIYQSTLYATDVRIDSIGEGAALRLYNSTSTIMGLVVGDTLGSPEIYFYGGKATVTDAILSGGGSDAITTYGPGATFTLASSTIAGFAQYGISVAGNSTVMVSSSTITDNGTGIQVWDGKVTVANSDIEGNTVGVNNVDTDSAVNATNNYWGDPDGPTMPAGPVEGDSVSVNVTVDPFLTGSLN